MTDCKKLEKEFSELTVEIVNLKFDLAETSGKEYKKTLSLYREKIKKYSTVKREFNEQCKGG